jgi:hypothetical protein
VVGTLAGEMTAECTQCAGLPQEVLCVMTLPVDARGQRRKLCAGEITQRLVRERCAGTAPPSEGRLIVSSIGASLTSDRFRPGRR